MSRTVARIKSKPKPKFATVADLVRQLGNISGERIRLDPTPGTATIRDLIRHMDRDDTLYELVDGTLVEKAIGYRESEIACELIRQLGNHITDADLGILTGADGTMKLMKGLVRVPDVAFVAWDSLPNRERPRTPVPDLGPDLAVEVLSESNTPGEMSRKPKEYFLSGAKCVWFFDPDPATVRVFSSPDEVVTLTAADTLTGDPVLPGFRLRLGPFFAKFGLPTKRKGGRKNRK
jgi:Uma2 family endonuclease